MTHQPRGPTQDKKRSSRKSEGDKGIKRSRGAKEGKEH